MPGTITRKQFFRSALVMASAGRLCQAHAAAAGGTGQAGAQTLRALATSCRFKIGAQVEKGPLQNPAFASAIAANFNIITPGNELKWSRVHPSPDKFDFTDGDWMVQFAQRNQMFVHGHNLCWNTTFNPGWFKDVITKDNAREYLTNHITTVVKHYAGQIDSWDVVNEPLVAWSKRPDGLYPGIWLNFLGSEYIDIAFQTAAAADPKALRVLNCYWIEGNSEGDDRTRANTLQLLKQLLGRRVPVQAIGIESHLTAPLALGGEKYKQFLSEVRDLGLQILITELDINDTPIAGGVNTLDTAVAQAYTDYLKQFTGVTPLNAVIFWTPSDQFNWMNSAKDAGHKRSDGQQHRAGLFDSNMNPKLAFTSVNAALAQLCQR